MAAVILGKSEDLWLAVTPAEAQLGTEEPFSVRLRTNSGRAGRRHIQVQAVEISEDLLAEFSAQDSGAVQVVRFEKGGAFPWVEDFEPHLPLEWVGDVRLGG